jgi:hypothetical protein
MKEGEKDCDEIAIDERVCLVLKFVLKKWLHLEREQWRTALVQRVCGGETMYFFHFLLKKINVLFDFLIHSNLYLFYFSN